MWWAPTSPRASSACICLFRAQWMLFHQTIDWHAWKKRHWLFWNWHACYLDLGRNKKLCAVFLKEATPAVARFSKSVALNICRGLEVWKSGNSWSDGTRPLEACPLAEWKISGMLTTRELAYIAVFLPEGLTSIWGKALDAANDKWSCAANSFNFVQHVCFASSYALSQRKPFIPRRWGLICGLSSTFGWVANLPESRTCWQISWSLKQSDFKTQLRQDRNQEPKLTDSFFRTSILSDFMFPKIAQAGDPGGQLAKIMGDWIGQD